MMLALGVCVAFGGGVLCSSFVWWAAFGPRS